MKFDVILANPPFDNGLHEKFEIKFFDLCKGQICWVSPASWLLGKQQNSNITSQINKYNSNIETINGNNYFDATIGGTMSIVYVDMKSNKTGQISFDGTLYNKCSDITLYSNDKLLMQFKSIIEPLYTKDNINNHIYASEIAENVPYKKMSYTGYVHKIDLFSGSGKTGSNGESFYTLFSKNKNIEDNINTYNYFIKTLKTKFKLYISFYKKQNAINFYNYCKTYFCRGCLYLSKTTLHLDRGELKYIPYFDFSNPIFNNTPEEIDKILFKKLNISQQIIDHIIELLPNYYNLDLTKYKRLEN